MRRFILRHLTCGVAVAIGGATALLHAEARPIDVGRSTVTVFVYKSGLFSALADNHVIRAPIAHGTISDGAPIGVEITIRSADLRVVDPGLPDGRRADVQARMVGREVLDVVTFPEMTFTSTTIEVIGADRWNVTGRLMIHGRTRQITFPVARLNGRYRGEARVKQRDFGIEPISIAGGTVKVRDELQIQFDIEPEGPDRGGR